jgi:energy-coupling factor transporter ATP-binding protein EcfA2
MTAPHSPDGGSRAIVSLLSASLGYGGHPIVSGVTLDIRAGQVVAILGPNGSGKSTLIKGLLGLNDNIGGEVEHFGAPIDRFWDHARVEYVPARHTSSASVRATHRRGRGGRHGSCRPAAGRCADDRAQRHGSAGCRQLPVGHANGRCARSCQQRGWGDSVVLCRHRSGGIIVLLAIALLLVAASYSALRGRITGRRHKEAEQHEHEHGPDCGHPAIGHQHHVDYLHDGHHHAPHEGHYDEHDPLKTHDQPVRH